jgi:gamma-glutamylcysteine synthetase
LVEIAAEGRSPADRLLADYADDWHGDIDRLFDTRAF